jgi:2-polyprenyl-3-methyl-5-hydroxy-6-metoxy-1,4-benzoquinol methylase
MTCCTSEGTNRFFSRSAEKYAKRFRRKGLDKASAYIVRGIETSGLTSKSVLEIGCGVGGLLLSLLKHGDASAIGVDVSEGMLEMAKKLAVESALDDRVKYLQGDYATMNGEASSADIVILDKVICCYADPETLIKKSAQKSELLYAVSYPRNSLLGRLSFEILTRMGQVLRWSFYPYYHDTAFIEKTITSCGFREVFSQTTTVWQIKIFRRRSIQIASGS